MCDIAGPRAWLELEFTRSNSGDLVGGQSVVIRRDEIGAKVSTGGGPGTILLPPGTTDYAVPFGAVVKANAVIIQTRGNITFKTNSIGAPSQKLNIIPADITGNPSSAEARYDQPGVHITLGTDVSSLYLSNPSLTASVSVDVTLYGEG